MYIYVYNNQDLYINEVSATTIIHLYDLSILWKMPPITVAVMGFVPNTFNYININLLLVLIITSEKTTYMCCNSSAKSAAHIAECTQVATS